MNQVVAKHANCEEDLVIAEGSIKTDTRGPCWVKDVGRLVTPPILHTFQNP